MQGCFMGSNNLVARLVPHLHFGTRSRSRSNILTKHRRFVVFFFFFWVVGGGVFHLNVVGSLVLM